jgi:hypothetical protein
MGWWGQATQHDADHGEAGEGRDGSGVPLEVAGQAAIAADLGKSTLDDPSLGQDDDEAMGIAPFDDLQAPEAGLGDDFGHLRPLVAGVGKDAFESCRSAGWMATLNKRPSVSTRMCRLRPVTFLPASKPCGSSAEPLI